MRRTNCAKYLRVCLFVAVSALWRALPAADTPANEPEILTLDETALFLRFSVEETRRFAEKSIIPGRRLGGRWRFSRSRLIAWLAGDELLPRSGTNVGNQSFEVDRVAVQDDWNLGNTRGRGAAIARDSDSSSVSETETIGERPELQQSEKVFLRDQQVLLGGGELSFELGAYYSGFEDRDLILLSPGIALGTIEDETYSTNFILRYGLTEQLQFFSSISYQDRRLRLLVTDPTTGVQRTTGLLDRAEWGDLGLGLRWTALREGPDTPNMIVSTQTRIPTGESSYALGAGIALVKSIDPAVVFGNISYLHTFSEEFDDVTRLQPEENLTIAFGYGLALNDSLSISSSLTGVFNGKTRFDNAILPADKRFILQFGLTARINEALHIEPTVSFDLGGSGSNYSFGINLPYSFGR